MKKIIYIHHFFSKSLFYKIAHNTTDRVFGIDESNTGFVNVKYKENEIKFIFNPIINYNEDGLHVVDYFSAYSQMNVDPNYTEIIDRNTVTDVGFLTKINELTENKKNWIILIFRTEKMFDKSEETTNNFVSNLEDIVDKLKNHYIISDNFFIDNLIKYQYPNRFFCLTNTIFQWNEIISIRWHYEYKNIFEKLNQPYDLCFSMRRHSKNRIEILNGLAKLNNNKIYLSKVDHHTKTYTKFYNNFEKNIHSNITKGDDFDDLSVLENIGEYGYLDYLMRILPMAKLHILSESWDFKNKNYTSNYLSEKTYGFLLAKVPFISTHVYPLDIIQSILQIEPHPFYDETLIAMGNPEKFVLFIENFMKNFDVNYEKCKKWVELAHSIIIQKINKENSLLELIFHNFENETKKIKKNLL